MARITAVREWSTNGAGEVRLYVDHDGGWGMASLDLRGDTYSERARDFAVLGAVEVTKEEVPYWDGSGVLDGPAVVALAQRRIAALVGV